MPSTVPVIDLSTWFIGLDDERAVVAEQVDTALGGWGFMMVTGHGVPAELRGDVRTASRSFFALPESVKARYLDKGARGWQSGGSHEAESVTFGSDEPVGDEVADELWYPSNIWIEEIPQLRSAVAVYLAEMRDFGDDILRLCAGAIGLRDDFYTLHTEHPIYSLNISHIPSADDELEPAVAVAPHTDPGMVAVLDREPAAGALQLWSEEDGWVDTPYHPEALTIVVGEMLRRWTGDRWRAPKRRVLCPSGELAADDVVSISYHYAVDYDATIAPLRPPTGHREYPSTEVGAFLREHTLGSASRWDPTA